MAEERNILLSLLSDNEFARLEPDCDIVPATVKEIVYELNAPIEDVYFPRTSVASFITVMSDGAMAEFATVGYEGMIGVPVFLGATRAAHRAFWQVSGEAIRISTETFRRESATGRLREVMQLYTQALFTQVAQHASCKTVHSVEQRTVKWLLMSHDRTDRDHFELTQEFLAQMVGTRRASINQTMSTLRDAGLLDYVRGVLTIKDRDGLEERLCECYGVINGEFERLLGVKFGR